MKQKSEEYTIKKGNYNNLWRDCKLLGSLQDTHNDFKRRKVFEINAANKLKNLFLDKGVNISLKTKLFKCYIASIFYGQ